MRYMHILRRMNLSSQTPIILNASNIAGLVNKNPYVHRADALLTAWKSTDKTSYYDAHKRNGVDTVEQKRRAIQRASPFITANIRAPKPQFMDVMSTASPTLFDTPNKAEFHSEGDAFTNKEVLDEAKRLAFTRYGTEREACILERVRQILPEYDFVHGEMGETPTVRREIGQTTSGHPIILQGKIDGISSDRKTVLECKTRMHRLFMKLREYEEVQARAYLELFPEASRVVLAEAYFGSRELPDMNIIFIERDCDTSGDWKTIVHHVAEVLAWIIDHPPLQDALIRSKNRGVLIQNLVTRAIDGRGPPPQDSP